MPMILINLLSLIYFARNRFYYHISHLRLLFRSIRDYSEKSILAKQITDSILYLLLYLKYVSVVLSLKYSDVMFISRQLFDNRYYHIFCCNMFIFECPIIALSQCWIFALRKISVFDYTSSMFPLCYLY
jgi:hypothetical protein